jgi:hypothetical protein
MDDKNRGAGGAQRRDGPLAGGDQEQRREPEPARKPSQAEGDRETIDEDIREKEAQGEL